MLYFHLQTGEKTNSMNTKVTLNISPAIRSDVSSTGRAIHDSWLTKWIHAAPVLTETNFIILLYNQETCTTVAIWRSSTWRNSNIFIYMYTPMILFYGGFTVSQVPVSACFAFLCHVCYIKYHCENATLVSKHEEN